MAYTNPQPETPAQFKHRMERARVAYAEMDTPLDDTVCAACGEPLETHTVLTRGGMRAHLMRQGRDGFARNGEIVHYTERQRRTNEDAMRTAMVLARNADTNRKAFDALLLDVPRDLERLVVLASAYVAENDTAGAGGALWTLFRQEARIEEARQAARIDWLDAADTRRWAA